MSNEIKEILELSDELEEQERHIKEANAEIDRLNNIINETIKMIEFEWKMILKIPRYDLHLHTVDGLTIKQILDKLKELKEKGNNG